MLALGLASARFFSFIYDQWTEIQVDLPQVNSETPIVIVTKPTLTKQFLYKQSFISKDRDLSQFDNAGEFTERCFSQDNSKECEKKKIEARQFLLNHWKEKKRATIKYYWSGADVEGEGYFFIEPDDNGRWRIIIIREYFGVGFIDNNLSLFEATSMKYKRATKDDYPFETGTYYLSFIDKNGEEVEGL
ncbi:MAG: hypothetical protein K1X72_29220 [Pyrinomonadaceae bacterium]|nr:hypothetical protein [Pyrinomonadaceae bacterium]